MAQTSPAPASITVLYFAAASTATGRATERIELPMTPFPLTRLGGLLTQRYPKSDLSTILERSQWSVDAEMVPEEGLEELQLKGGEEVAIICPVSGG